MARFSMTRHPDISRFVQVAGEHRSIVVSDGFQSASTSLWPVRALALLLVMFAASSISVGKELARYKEPKDCSICRKSCILLPYGGKFTRCPQSLKMQCCGSNRHRMGQQGGRSAAACWGKRCLQRVGRGVEGTLNFSNKYPMARRSAACLPPGPSHLFICRNQPSPVPLCVFPKQATEHAACSAGSVQSTGGLQKLGGCVSNTISHRSAVSSSSFSAPSWLLCNWWII